jgi:hypothetical protein
VHHNLGYKLEVKFQLNFENVCLIFEVVNPWLNFENVYPIY